MLLCRRQTYAQAIQSDSCLLDNGEETNKDDSMLLNDVKWLAPQDVSIWGNGWDHKHTIRPGESGMYQLMFERCFPDDLTTTISFDINVTMYNVRSISGERDYLSAGDSALPLIFFFFSIVFGLLGVFWLYICHKGKEYVHHVHMLMLILVGLKMMASLFRGVSYYSLQRYGYPVGWNIIFYVFTFLKGTMLFSVIMLVGTGWSLLKVGPLLLNLPNLSLCQNYETRTYLHLCLTFSLLYNHFSFCVPDLNMQL